MGAINPVNGVFYKVPEKFEKDVQDTALSCPGTRIGLLNSGCPSYTAHWHITLFPKYF